MALHTIRLGDLLVKRGVLTPRQRDAILAAQLERRRPFGALAEEMFDVSPEAVESAWAEQFASMATKIDPRRATIDEHTLELISRRQAWQFRVLPIEVEAERSTLVLCTTSMHLVRAMKFAGWRLGHNCQFVLADPLPLGEALMSHYPMAGMTPEVACTMGIAV